MNKTDKRPSHLQFNVSSGLKSVLGRELIIDDEVAIFELVKNSFDAAASCAYIYFTNTSIWVIDDGKGMSYDDILSKWLYVAYSEKKDQMGFRERIQDRQHFAGSKGIGRFSSDRLGRTIVLQTQLRDSNDSVHRVEIDWDSFDKDTKNRFDKIPVIYSESDDFSIPNSVPRLENGGTAIEIQGPRIRWERDKILKLKRSLAKLINPFGANTDDFKVFIFAPEEQDTDDQITSNYENPEDAINLIVNAEVKNFIFSDLQSKTTFINVSIDKDTGKLETDLIDRGELIYKIREDNPYPLLNNAEFSCQIYYLNRSAKHTFTSRMGVPSIQFGSVFLFRNGFRVFPVGEDGDDWFGVNRRKQQGYARFLGSRDIIGRVDVSGSDEYFQEASSRNQGLIETQAVRQLRMCFREHCLKRLEKYVVPVSWIDKGEADTSDLSRLLTESGKARVAEAVAKLIDTENVELLEYSHKLISLINERSVQFEPTLVNLRYIAEKTNDQDFLQKIGEAEKRFEALKRTEAEARRIAEEEREAKIEAQKKAAFAEALTVSVIEELEEEKKKNLFLQSISTLDSDTILNLHHQITIYAVDIGLQIENFLLTLDGQEEIKKEPVLAALEQISFLNSKIKTITKFATKANFRLQSDEISADLAQYMEEYINKIVAEFLQPGLTISLTNNHPGFIRTFKPIDISIVVDNFISNAKKARSTTLDFIIEVSSKNKNMLTMQIIDDGQGMPANVEHDQLFEKGFSRTDGAGLGLYHIRQVLDSMNGSVRIEKSSPGYTKFTVEIMGEA